MFIFLNLTIVFFFLAPKGLWFYTKVFSFFDSSMYISIPKYNFFYKVDKSHLIKIEREYNKAQRYNKRQNTTRLGSTRRGRRTRSLNTKRRKLNLESEKYPKENKGKEDRR